jgi:hypothetical protein
MDTREGHPEGLGIEHITLHDFRAAAYARSQEFRASGKTAYTPSLGLQVLEQPASDVPCCASKKYQDLSIMIRDGRVKGNEASITTADIRAIQGRRLEVTETSSL